MLAMCAIMQRCLALERGRARGLTAELDAERARTAELEALLPQAAGGEAEGAEGEDAAMQVPAAGGKAAAPAELAAAED